MSEIERRTVDEILARYELEPELKDFYVEGTFDKDVVFACTGSDKKSGIAVYEINGVDIPPEVVFAQGLTEGNKQRLIVLARKLSLSLSGECSVMCLVDRNLDHWLGELESAKYLRWTRFCSMEACFFTEATAQSMMIDFHGAKISDFKGFFNSVENALRDLYAMRLADASEAWAMTWLSPDKYLSRDGDQIRFDVDLYINRLLIRNSKIKDLDNFLFSYSQWRAKLVGDCRISFRGHDLVEVLVWAAKQFAGYKSLASSLSFERAMVMLAGQSPEVNKDVCAEIF